MLKDARFSLADVAIPAAVAAAFALLAVWRLETPPKMVFDEKFHALYAMDYLAGKEPDGCVQPPLAILMIASSILALGGQADPASTIWTAYSAFSWRFGSLVVGTLTLLVMYALTRCLFNKRAVAALAMSLLALDGVFFVQSRVAMTNIFTVFFVLLSTLGLCLYMKSGRDRWLLMMGFELGCAIACRWTGLFAWGLIGLLLLWHVWRTKWPQWSARESCAWTAKAVVSMCIVPLLIYVCAYVPYVMEDNVKDHSWSRVISLQKTMWQFHASTPEGWPGSSPWWSWPLLKKPMVYYVNDEGQGKMAMTWAIGNAFIWWASVPALLAAGYFSWRRKTRDLAVIACLGLGLWLLWAIQPRPVLYTHYMFESIPFACMAIAYCCHSFWSQNGLRLIVSLYLALVPIWFFIFYPLLSAMPVSVKFCNQLMWFGRSW